MVQEDLLKKLSFALVLPLLVAGVPVPAQNLTAFDGNYVGVSLTMERFAGSGGGVCRPAGSPVPGTLVISNGVAKTPTTEGSVSPQGVLSLRDRSGYLHLGQVDAQGNATTRSSGNECFLTAVWRKAPR